MAVCASPACACACRAAWLDEACGEDSALRSDWSNDTNWKRIEGEAQPEPDATPDKNLQEPDLTSTGVVRPFTIIRWK